MFGFVKNLFTRSGGEKKAAAAPASPAPTREAKPAAPAPAPAPARTAAPAAAPAAASSPQQTSIEVVSLSLKVIVSHLPPELQAKLLHHPKPEVRITVPTRKVLAQLPTGSVKITFGELRQASPPGTFAEISSHDQSAVNLPLAEILPNINPGLIKRRPNQKAVHVPPEISNLFGGKGQVLPPPAALVEKAAKPAPAQAAPAAATPAPAHPKPAPAAEPIRPSAPIQMPSASRDAAAKPAPTAAPVPPPSKPAAPVRLPPAPARTAPAPPVAVSTERVSVLVAVLSEGWPEPVRQELATLGAEVTVSLPADEVDKGLRAGKVVFTWKQLRSWVMPAPPVATSPHDEATLELPLKSLVPLFMAARKPVTSQKKLVIAEGIPDLFTAVAGKAAAAAPAAAPSATPVAAPARPMATPPAGTPAAAPAPAGAPAAVPALAAAPSPKAAPDLGEIFGQPGKKNWTPNEIVQKTAGVNGVAGALIAMQDGLLVAGKLPEPLRSETVAAFTPQIFGRINQYTKELNIGEVNEITFRVENVPWQIFKAGTVFFVVIGRAGEAMPATQLGVIAVELTRQTKK